MTVVEVELLFLGIAMVLTAGLAYWKWRSTVLTVVIVFAYLALAYKAGLIV